MKKTSGILASLLTAIVFFPFSANANSGGFDGGIVIGSSYVTTYTSPTNGMLVQGLVGIGTSNPATGLDVEYGSSAPLRLKNTSGPSGYYWNVGPDGNSNFIIYNQSNTGVWLATGGTGWNSSSDKRLKENIVPLKDALAKITAIEGVTYFWKDKNRNSDEQVGVLADDVQKVYPQLVASDANGMLGVNYAGLVAPLIEAVKQLKADNEELRAEFETYKKEHP